MKYGVFRTAFLLAVCMAPACHSMRFEVSDAPVGDIVHDRKSYFLGGLFPTKEVDVSERCPRGVVAVEEETTFGDGFFELITLSIWSPRSSTYYCR